MEAPTTPSKDKPPRPRASDSAKVSSDRDQAPEHSHQRAAKNAGEDHLAIEEDRLDEILVDGAVGHPDEKERQQAAQDSLDQTIQQEGQTNEHVRRAYKAHDGDLL